MNTMMSFRRIAAAAALLGTASLLTAAPAAAEDVLFSHALWTSVVYHDAGQLVCGVRTRMDQGGEVRLRVIDDQVDMVVVDPAWHLQTGATYRVKISIDGEMFNGKASAANSEALVVGGLTERFLDYFIQGDSMLADWGGVRWDINLAGSGRATDDMLNCVRAARSGADS